MGVILSPLKLRKREFHLAFFRSILYAATASQELIHFNGL